MGFASCKEDTYCFGVRLHQPLKSVSDFPIFDRLHSSGINKVQTRGSILFWKDPKASTLFM